MKEILRKGTIKDVHIGKCPRCKTEFTYTPDELMELRFFDESGIEYRKVSVYCPECGIGFLVYEYIPVY